MRLVLRSHKSWLLIRKPLQNYSKHKDFHIGVFRKCIGSNSYKSTQFVEKQTDRGLQLYEVVNNS